MRLQILAVFTLTALTGLAACQKEATPAAPAQQAQQQAPAQTEPPAQAPQQAVAPTSGESLIREPVAAQSQPVQAIQTKTFGEYTIHLTKAKVVGQILSVEFIAVPPKDANGKYKGVSGEYFPLKDFVYIDETTSKKVTLLQDENGKYMANPLSRVSEELRLEGHQRFPQALTLKFPAPPATSPTITIDFPKVGSFESVPVSR